MFPYYSKGYASEKPPEFVLLFQIFSIALPFLSLILYIFLVGFSKSLKVSWDSHLRLRRMYNQDSFPLCRLLARNSRHRLLVHCVLYYNARVCIFGSKHWKAVSLPLSYEVNHNIRDTQVFLTNWSSLPNSSFSCLQSNSHWLCCSCTLTCFCLSWLFWRH